MLFLTHPGCWYGSLYAHAYNDSYTEAKRAGADVIPDVPSVTMIRRAGSGTLDPVCHL